MVRICNRLLLKKKNLLIKSHVYMKDFFPPGIHELGMQALFDASLLRTIINQYDTGWLFLNARFQPYVRNESK